MSDDPDILITIRATPIKHDQRFDYVIKADPLLRYLDDMGGDARRELLDAIAHLHLTIRTLKR